MIFRFVFRATHGLARLGKERTELFDEVYNVHFTNTRIVVRCSSKRRPLGCRIGAVKNGWHCIVISSMTGILFVREKGYLYFQDVACIRKNDIIM